jgi:hypothetical protein
MLTSMYISFCQRHERLPSVVSYTIHPSEKLCLCLKRESVEKLLRYEGRYSTLCTTHNSLVTELLQNIDKMP